MAGRLAAVACLATIVTASLIAQAAATTDVGVSDGTRTYTVARIVDGRVSAGPRVWRRTSHSSRWR